MRIPTPLVYFLSSLILSVLPAASNADYQFTQKDCRHDKCTEQEKQSLQQNDEETTLMNCIAATGGRKIREVFQEGGENWGSI